MLAVSLQRLLVGLIQLIASSHALNKGVKGMQFRVHLSIRERGQAPFDDREFKSENYDTLEEYAEAVSQAVLDNAYDQLEGEDDEPA